LTRPRVKCRGREHLRIVYGPDYTERANLARLRRRSVERERSLALREHALGSRRPGSWTASRCGGVFAVLALESEPVEPRL
jgi:PNKP (polynucleotide 5'-kinase/3'-phosphatase) family adenylyltransferase-like protein